MGLAEGVPRAEVAGERGARDAHRVERDHDGRKNTALTAVKRCTRVRSPGCTGEWTKCGSNTYPAGSFPECRSTFGVYDQHGNAAEHMNLPTKPEELGAKGGLGQTEMKGSWFIFSQLEAHEDELIHGDLRPENILLVKTDAKNQSAGRAVLLRYALHHIRWYARQQRLLLVDRADLLVRHRVRHLDGVHVVDAEREHVLVSDGVDDGLVMGLGARALCVAQQDAYGIAVLLDRTQFVMRLVVGLECGTRRI